LLLYQVQLTLSTRSGSQQNFETTNECIWTSLQNSVVKDPCPLLFSPIIVLKNSRSPVMRFTKWHTIGRKLSKATLQLRSRTRNSLNLFYTTHKRLQHDVKLLFSTSD